MLKVAIITDSNSGLIPEEAKQLGIHLLPMPFMVDDETFLENITLSSDVFYERLIGGSSILTSQPSLDALMTMWDSILEEYDEIVHIPMSSGLSGSYETAYMLARKYHEKVQVVNNLMISITQKQSALDALELAKNGKNAKEILEILEGDSGNNAIYLTVSSLQYLKKGGRITPTAAALGTLLKIKPVLQIKGDKIDAFAKARTIKQAKNIMIAAIRKDIVDRFGEASKDNQIDLYVVHSRDLEAAENFRDELEKEFIGYPIFIFDISLSIACHTGPGTLAIACIKRMKHS